MSFVHFLLTFNNNCPKFIFLLEEVAILVCCNKTKQEPSGAFEQDLISRVSFCGLKCMASEEWTKAHKSLRLLTRKKFLLVFKVPEVSYLYHCSLALWSSHSMLCVMNCQAGLLCFFFPIAKCTNIYIKSYKKKEVKNTHLGTRLLGFIHSPWRLAFWPVPFIYSNHTTRGAKSKDENRDYWLVMLYN